jgi:cysteinyl-tRNA synthetase
MSEALLGPLPFDLHGGGIDLIFPHHENEIAQSCCARGVERMARVWMHNGFVDMRGQKMAKSVGNVVRVDEALAQVPGEVLRLWLLGTHYRQPADYSEEALAEAKRTLARFYGALARVPAAEGEPDREMVAALGDDLNTPNALAILHEQLTGLNRAPDPQVAARLRASAGLLGLLQDAPDAWLKGGAQADDQVEALIAKRQAARAGRDFARADAIRAELAAQGILLEDGPTGTTWRRA